MLKHLSLLFMLTGMFVCHGQTPDWSMMLDTLRKSHGDREADSLLQNVKMDHYAKQNDRKAYSTLLVEFELKYGRDRSASDLNNLAWTVFKYSDNKEELKTALGWSLKTLDAAVDKERLSTYRDTYANLQYKFGNRRVAIDNQRKAFLLLSGKEKMLISGRLISGKQKIDRLITLFKILDRENTWSNDPWSTHSHFRTWRKLGKWLNKVYNPYQADSILLRGKIGYYKEKKNYSLYIASIFSFVNKIINTTNREKNDFAREVFVHGKEISELEQVLEWYKVIINDSASRSYPVYLDTYASILYKLNRIGDAILWQRMAVDKASGELKEEYRRMLEKMENGKMK